MANPAQNVKLDEYLSVTFRDGDMAADVVVRAHDSPITVEVSDIEYFLHEAGVVTGIHPGAIQIVHRKLLSRMSTDSCIPVAVGQSSPNVPLELNVVAPVVPPSPNELGGDLATVAASVDRYGRVDEGDKVAVIRTKDGSASRSTVRGKPVSVVRSAEETFRLGPDLATETDGDQVVIRAQTSGWLFERDGRISIQPLDIIDSRSPARDARHRHVLVLGDLTRSIRVCGHVLVTGNVVGVTIETTGSVMVAGTIRTSRIVAAGDLTARNARGSRLEIDGGVCLDDAMDLCTTAAGKDVHVGQRIAGGSIVCGGNIRAGDIGNPERIPTDVEICPRLVYRRRIQRLNHNITDARERLDRIRRAAFRDSGTPRLDAARLEREIELSELLNQRERLKNASRRNLSATTIEIENTLYAGVSLGLDDIHCESTARTHRVRVLLGHGGRSLRFERNWD